MTVEEKMELLAEVFDMESEDISKNMVLTEMDEWDSMTKLSLIVMFDDECNKKITSEDIKGFVTIQDILNYME